MADDNAKLSIDAVLKPIGLMAGAAPPRPPRPPEPPYPPRPPRPPQPPRPDLFDFLKEPLFMGIFSRTRDIIAANVTDLLDKAEDPAKMIRMIIMEMEETLVEVRASAARTIADQKEMRRQIAKLDRMQDGWVEKAELALSKNREDLAKAALFEKQKAADMADQLKAEIEVLDDALRASEADIAKLQNKLREARTRQNAITTRMESAQNRARMREMYAGPKVEDAFSRFDVLERRADMAEGHADALALGAAPKTLDEEIAELRSSDKVDAELEALKASLAKRSNEAKEG
jgi:phage shock protein A